MDGFGVNRLTLREILLADLDVHFGHSLTIWSHMDDGRVRLTFGDGSSTCWYVPIWHRRRSLTASKCAAYGRAPILDDTLFWPPDFLTKSFNRITAPDGPV